MALRTLRRLGVGARPLIDTRLGNAAIRRGDGIESVARDWGERVPLPGGGDVVVLRNQHWGSRWGTDRNRALWSAFAVHTPHGNIFLGGDTGWGDGSWVDEAARLGPYRLAIIPIGAYLPRDIMQNSHMGPEEALRVFHAFNPVMALGVHWGTFQLAFEGIDDPPRTLAALVRQRSLPPGRFLTTEAGQPFSVPAR
jgi:L-ascorbate metabolism protein UlaG (beta-lactamase superfamily)